MDQVWPIGCEGNSTMQATVIFPSPVSVLLYRNTREGCRSYLRTRISPSIMNGGWVAEQSVFVPSLTWIDCRVGAVFSVPRRALLCHVCQLGFVAVAFTDGRSPKSHPHPEIAMHGGNERSDTCTALFVLSFAKTRLRLSNQKGWANYPDGSRQLSNITKFAIVGHAISPPSVLPLRGSRAAVQNYRHLLGWKRASSLKERSAGAGNRLPHSDSPPAVRRNRKSAHSGGETRYKCLSSLSLSLS